MNAADLAKRMMKRAPLVQPQEPQTERNADMPDDTRDRRGPLSKTQRQILQRLSEGWTHEKVAKELGMSRDHVGRILGGSILPKMGCKRTMEAVCAYARAQGYLKAAQELRDGLVPYPVGETEGHTNHVLEGMAVTLTRMANDLVP